MTWRPPRHPVHFLPTLSLQWPAIGYPTLSDVGQWRLLLPGSVKLSFLHIFSVWMVCPFSRLSASALSFSVLFCLSRLHITTEDTCNKLVEKKNIFWSMVLEILMHRHLVPILWGLRQKSTHERELRAGQSWDTEEGMKGALPLARPGDTGATWGPLFIRQHPFRVSLCLGPSFLHTHLEEILDLLDPFLSFLLF